MTMPLYNKQDAWFHFFMENMVCQGWSLKALCLVFEWAEILTDMLQNLVESFIQNRVCYNNKGEVNLECDLICDGQVYTGFWSDSVAVNICSMFGSNYTSNFPNALNHNI